jgi:hypothetical protein
MSTCSICKPVAEALLTTKVATVALTVVAKLATVSVAVAAEAMCLNVLKLHS